MIQRVAEEGGDEDDMHAAVQDALKARFLPEFLNRIDETIIFEPLRKDQINRIVRLQIRRLEKQLLEKHIPFSISERAIEAIADEGYDPVYGARPLKRVIQRRLQNRIASELLKRDPDDMSPISVDYMDGDFVIGTEQVQAIS
jgi:ATP-dependent Clp protease ATP-binding subunit ClpB